jgi:hypothetical protein
MAFDWPNSEWGGGSHNLNQNLGDPGQPGGGPNGTGLYPESYTEITWRAPVYATVNNSGTSGFLIMDFWEDGCNGCGLVGGASEVDFFEVGTPYYGITPPGPWEFDPGGGPFYGGMKPTFADITVYHTYGYLMTNDGTNAQMCSYLDNVKVSCGGYTETDHNPNKIMAIWMGSELCFGDNTFNNRGCEVNDATGYIKSIRRFSCPAHWSDPCLGPVTTGSLDEPKPTPTLFSRVRYGVENFAHNIGKLLIPLAFAQGIDPFDAPSQGYWICPDGKQDLFSKCMPAEFKQNFLDVSASRAKPWWVVCLPGRFDCVPSNTAYIGSKERRAVRGPGLCYTGQPFTCSPSGKLPTTTAVSGAGTSIRDRLLERRRH